MNLAWDCVRMKKQCSLLMQLEMNSFVQENAWIQNPWIVHAVSMKTYQRQAWKPLGQARKPIQMCGESVSIVLCVCVWVCVCFRLIHQRHELNERITHTWLTASKMNYSQNVCVLSTRVDRGSGVESNQQASRLQTYDKQGTLWVWPYLNLIVLQQNMTEKMVIVLGDISKKKLGRSTIW